MKQKAKQELPPAPQPEPAPPRPRQFVAPPCSQCSALREPGTNYSRVYGTTRKVDAIYRYVRCHYCGFSWTLTERILQRVAVSEQS
jgi:hypothetical protein